MTSRTANFGLLLLDIFAIEAVYSCYKEHAQLMDRIIAGAEQIVFDSGLYYSFLMSIFPLIHFFVLLAFLFKSKAEKLPVVGITIFWAIVCLLFANLMPLYTESVISDAGYHQCGKAVRHRISRGSNIHYSLSKCTETIKKQEK